MSIEFSKIRRLAGIASCLAIWAFLPATAPADQPDPSTLPYDAAGPFPMLGPEYGRDHAVVHVSDQGLRPRVLTLRAGQRAAWKSGSSSPSTIVFDADVARDMTCRHVVNFALDGGTLRSAELHTGDLASFCSLAPGHYRYSVERRGPDHPRGTARHLDGVIRVAGP